LLRLTSNRLYFSAHSLNSVRKSDAVKPRELRVIRSSVRCYLAPLLPLAAALRHHITAC
jgi:hypothetical protein